MSPRSLRPLYPSQVGSESQIKTPQKKRGSECHNELDAPYILHKLVRQRHSSINQFTQEKLQMAYSQRINQGQPGLILISLDQSGSMSDLYGNGSKADEAAMAVNRVIYEIQEASQKGEKIVNRCMLVVVGYGQSIEPVVAGHISQLAENPIEVKMVKKMVSDQAGGLVEIDWEIPIWVEPKAENGTPMAEAFEKAYELAEQWIEGHPDNFPPIVINITDGEPNDMSRTMKAAQNLMSLATNDGKLLLFNAHISNKTVGEIQLPNNRAGLSDNLAKFLFDISSELPAPLMSAAEKVGFAPQAGARGCVFNAKSETLIKLLNFGTTRLTSQLR